MSRPVRQAGGRPLLVTDCDEVLLHMVSHFAEWLAEAHGIRFAFESGRFEDMFSDCATGSPVPGERGWQMLDLFFRDEMHRQTLVPERPRRSSASARAPTSSSSPTSATRRASGGSTSSPATASPTRWSATVAARVPRSPRCSPSAGRAPQSSSTTFRSITSRWRSMRRRSGGCT